MKRPGTWFYQGMALAVPDRMGKGQGFSLWRRRQPVSQQGLKPSGCSLPVARLEAVP
jgi:hypothetical protein